MNGRITKLFKVLVIGGSLAGCAREPAPQTAETAVEASGDEPAVVEEEASESTETGVDSWLSWT